MERLNEVSVLMCVYKTKEEYLRTAIESILNQSFNRFEFIIVVDGPDAQVQQIIDGYQDNRIKTVVNKENIGLTASLNVGLQYCSGRYIARMDADDKSFSERLQEQYDYMEQKKNVAVLGSYAFNLGTTERTVFRHTNNQELLKIRMMFYNAGIIHPTAFIRKDFLDKYNLRYDEKIKTSQDYELWTRVLQYGRIEVLPKYLLYYRVHNEQVTKNRSRVDSYTNETRNKLWSKIGVRLSAREQELLTSSTSNEVQGSKKEWINLTNKLIQWNLKEKVFNHKLFLLELRRLWLHSALKKISRHKKFDLFLSSSLVSLLKVSNINYMFSYYLKENR